MLKVIVNDLGKAVTVRAEEHGIAGVGWKRRMQQQKFIQAGPAYRAGQQFTLRN
ncbi:hypothetical protein D3C81_2210290 [compost metagenome]